MKTIKVSASCIAAALLISGCGGQSSAEQKNVRMPPPVMVAVQPAN